MSDLFPRFEVAFAGVIDTTKENAADRLAFMSAFRDAHLKRALDSNDGTCVHDEESWMCKHIDYTCQLLRLSQAILFDTTHTFSTPMACHFVYAHGETHDMLVTDCMTLEVIHRVTQSCHLTLKWFMHKLGFVLTQHEQELESEDDDDDDNSDGDNTDRTLSRASRCVMYKTGYSDQWSKLSAATADTLLLCLRKCIWLIYHVTPYLQDERFFPHECIHHLPYGKHTAYEWSRMYALLRVCACLVGGHVVSQKGTVEADQAAARIYAKGLDVIDTEHKKGMEYVTTSMQWLEAFSPIVQIQLLLAMASFARHIGRTGDARLCIDRAIELGYPEMWSDLKDEPPTQSLCETIQPQLHADYFKLGLSTKEEPGLFVRR